MPTTMYTAFTYPQLATGEEYRGATLPSTFTTSYISNNNFNMMSVNIADRTLYFEDTAGKLTYEDVQLALIGFDGLKTNKIINLRKDYEAYVSSNIEFTTTAGVTDFFQCDTASELILMQTAQRYNVVGSLPGGFYWVTASNNRIPFTLDDLNNLFAATLQRGWVAFQAFQDLKILAKNARQPSDLNTIIWTMK